VSRSAPAVSLSAAEIALRALVAECREDGDSAAGFSRFASSGLAADAAFLRAGPLPAGFWTEVVPLACGSFAVAVVAPCGAFSGAL
jgi:hypothetical protein